MAEGPSCSESRNAVRIHPTAIIEDNVNLGKNTSVWDSVHIRHGAKIGHDSIIGEKSYVAYDVSIGNFVKINAFVYIPTGVTVEDKVMISAGCIFTNDSFPRAYDYDKNELASSDPNQETLNTVVREGATLGAACVILGGVEIGRFALVGAGAVVTKTVTDHALVVGSPARQIGWVCVCGKRLDVANNSTSCVSCKRKYNLADGKLTEKK